MCIEEIKLCRLSGYTLFYRSLKKDIVEIKEVKTGNFMQTDAT